MSQSAAILGIRKNNTYFADDPPVFMYNLLQYRTKYYNLDTNLYDKDNKMYLPCSCTIY